MTNWCVAFLSGSVLLAFCGSAYSLKCYHCIASSEKECETNRTLESCKDSYNCVTAMYSGQLDYTYMKRCLPLLFINSYCATLNGTGLIQNCSITSCSRDYCNGPTPTEPTVRTTDVTSPSEGTSQEAATTEKVKRGTRSGGPSTNFRSSAFGLTVAVFVLGKILEICTIS